MNIKLILGIAAAAGLAYFFTTSKGKEVLSQLGENVNDLYSQGEEVIKNASSKLAQKGREVSNNVSQPFNA